jgi:hypothetical protein
MERDWQILCFSPTGNRAERLFADDAVVLAPQKCATRKLERAPLNTIALPILSLEPTEYRSLRCSHTAAWLEGIEVLLSDDRVPIRLQFVRRYIKENGAWRLAYAAWSR